MVDDGAGYTARKDHDTKTHRDQLIQPKQAVCAHPSTMLAIKGTRDPETLADLRHLLAIRGGFDKERVCPGGDVAFSARQRSFEALDRDGIRFVPRSKDRRSCAQPERLRSCPPFSAAETSRLPAKMSAPLGKLLCLPAGSAAAPARSNRRMVRCTFSAFPNPVSASTIRGSATRVGDIGQ